MIFESFFFFFFYKKKMWDLRVGQERRLRVEGLVLSNCGAGKYSWESLGQSVLKEINLEYSLEGLMLKLRLQYLGHLMQRAHWKRLWCWERLRAGGEGSNRQWDDWIASPTQWTWVWANFAEVSRVAKSRTQLSHWTTANVLERNITKTHHSSYYLQSEVSSINLT